MILSTKLRHTLTKKYLFPNILIALGFSLLVTCLMLCSPAQAKTKKPCFRKKISTLTVGKKFRYKIRHLPKKATVSYRSNHPKYASIQKRKGVLTAKKQGTVTIRASVTVSGKKKTVLKTHVRILGQKKATPSPSKKETSPSSNTTKTTGLTKTSLKVSPHINPWNHSFILYSSRILLRDEVVHSTLTLQKEDAASAATNNNPVSVCAKFQSLSDDGKEVTYKIDDNHVTRLCLGNGSANGKYNITGNILPKQLSIHYQERLSPNEIRGFVFDTNHNALSDVTVSLFENCDGIEASQPYSTTKTDQNGYYVFSGFPDSSYSVSFSRDGYMDASSDSVPIQNSIHCENKILKSQNQYITCQITNYLSEPLSNIPVILTKKDNSLQWRGTTDAQGRISFSNTKPENKDDYANGYTKISYQNGIRTPEYIPDAMPFSDSSSQIISTQYSPSSEYELTICPKETIPPNTSPCDMSNPYETLSFSFCPNDSYTEQTLFQVSLSTVPVLQTSELSIKSDTDKSSVSYMIHNNIDSDFQSIQIRFYEPDGCLIFSGTAPVNTSSSLTTHSFAREAVELFDTQELRLQDGEYYISMQPVDETATPTHAAWISSVTIANGTLPPLTASFNSGTSARILLSSNAPAEAHSPVPCTLYEFVESQWLPIATLQSSNFESVTQTCSKAYVETYPLLPNHTYRLESEQKEVCFTGNNSFSLNEEMTPSLTENSIPLFQISCRLQDDSFSSDAQGDKLHIHSCRHISCDLPYFQSTAHIRDCVYAYYQEDGSLYAAFLLPHTERPAIHDSETTIRFFDKLQNGKSIRTSQTAYRSSELAI